MKVALLADPVWWKREPTLMRRLAVGLVDEQVRTVRIVPAEVAAADGDLQVLSPAIPYASSSWWIWRHWLIGRLGDSLGQQRPDLIHAMDGSLLAPAAKLARELELPLAASIWSMAEMGWAPKGLPGGLTLLAATGAIAERLRARTRGTANVVVVEPGAFSRGEQEGSDPFGVSGRPLGILILSDGKVDAMSGGLLEGLAEARHKLPPFMCFLDGGGADQHALWQVGRGVGLLDCMTVVPHQAASREWLLQCDLVIQPQATGVARTLTLEAMAWGRPVIAAADPMLDYLREGQTAIQVQHTLSSDRWAAQLVELLNDRPLLLRLGESARQYVKTHHSPSNYIRRTLELYRRLAAEPIKFEGRP